METIILWSFEGGYLFQHIATLFQIMKMTKKKNSECVSLETNILFLIGAISRVFWVPSSTLSGLFILFILPKKVLLILLKLNLSLAIFI